MTLFRPKQTIRATTQQEVDAALDTADEVIVEGDDRLLSYAIGKASRDPDNVVSINLSGASDDHRIYSELADGIQKEGRKDTEERLWRQYSHLGPPQTLPSSPAPKRSRKSLIYAAVVGVLVGNLIMLALPRISPLPSDRGSNFSAPIIELPPSQSLPPESNEHRPQPQIDTPPQAVPEPPPAYEAIDRATPAPDIAAVLQALAWPAVAIVAIVALFLIARQAIAGDRNVEIAWKVTEKVTGRVVITKVKTPVPKAQKAA